VVLYPRESGTAGPGAGPLPHRKPDDRPHRREKVRRQQVHST